MNPTAIIPDQGKEWYSPGEVAAMLGRAAYTVREWCRLGRMEAHKRACGRGIAQEWEIHTAEITRYMNHGLLPSRYAKGAGTSKAHS